jgi:hypothetical protein
MAISARTRDDLLKWQELYRCERAEWDRTLAIIAVQNNHYCGQWERETGLEPATTCLEAMLSPVGLFPPFSQLISLGRLSLVLSGSQCPITLP